MYGFRCSRDTAVHVTITVSVLHINFCLQVMTICLAITASVPSRWEPRQGRASSGAAPSGTSAAASAGTGLRRVSATSPVSVNYCVNYWLNNEASLLPSATRFAKVMFLYLSVCPQGGAGGVPGQAHSPDQAHPAGKHPPPGITTPWEAHPPPLRRLTLRTVRILLECILVHTCCLGCVLIFCY